MNADLDMDLDQPTNLTKREVLALLGYVILWQDNPYMAQEIAQSVLDGRDTTAVSTSRYIIDRFVSTKKLPSPDEVLANA